MTRLGLLLRLAGLVVGLALMTWLVVANVPAGVFPGTSNDYLLLPDVAHPVAPLVSVQKAHPAKGGRLYFVDVIERRASTLEELFPSIHPHASLVPASEIVPPGTTSQAVLQAELREMSMSQRIAAAVALRQLGYHVVVHANGVLVTVVYLNTNAVGKLQPTDVILSVDGTPTPTLPRIHQVLTPVTPGHVVTLRVRRGSKTVTERIRTVNAKGRALIGVEVAQAADIKLPIHVSIDAHGIGGPSAGLAFALEVMQKLGHDVTNGYKVAATGEMELNGTVGAIGGVKQKTWGVREAGADVFLVPAGDNAKVARRWAGPLKIIPVRSLAQALHALATLPPKR